MRRKDRTTVAGVHAPGPRATPWAALLVALAASLVFLLLLVLWRLAALALG